MKYIKNTLITFLFCLSFNLQAQYFDAGIEAGTSYYRGELYHGSSEAFFKQLHPTAGVFGRYNFSDFFSVRLGVNYGRVSGSDEYAEDAFNRSRNLSFRSAILEGSIRGEVHLPGYDPYNFNKPLSPFLFIGVSVFNFNPEAQLDGEWYELQPLGTEGQGLAAYPEREEYSLTDIAIPLGIGIKYALTDRITLGAEWSLRLTSTDYLDDVSTTYVPYSELLAERGALTAALANRTGEYLGTEPVETDGPRGNASDNDRYGSIVIFASYNFIDSGLGGSRRRNRSRNGCRTR